MLRLTVHVVNHTNHIGASIALDFGIEPVSLNGFDSDHTSGSVFCSDSRRKAPRRAVRIAGEVSFGDRANRMDCRIVDISSTGARLRINTIDQVATPRIGLYFDQQSTNVECQVIWIRDGEVGVKFCSQFYRQGCPN